MSVDFVSCTPSDGAAWSLLVGCLICSKQHCHCCWPCSCTMLLGSILTPYSIVLCICRFCGLYILFHILWPVYSVYSVARGCSMLNDILMIVMQWQIQHQAMRNSMILTFLSRLFHLLLLPWQSKRLFAIQFSNILCTRSGLPHNVLHSLVVSRVFTEQVSSCTQLLWLSIDVVSHFLSWCQWYSPFSCVRSWSLYACLLF